MAQRPLLRLVTLLLYLGPLSAGLAGFGWPLALAFVAIFLVWQVILRPADWPILARPLSDADAGAARASAGALTNMLARAGLVVVLVAACFGIGRGIGGALGFISGVPVMVPLALSFVAIPLARLVRDPAAGPLRDDPPAVEGTVIAAAPAEPADLREAIGPLLALPDSTPDAAAQAAGARLGGSPLSAALLRALREALTFHDNIAPAARRGLVLWSTEPAVADRFEGASVLSEAWSAAKGWPDLERRFAERGLALLRDDPALGGDFPSETDLRAAAAARDSDGAAALTALADAVAQARGQRPRAAGGGA